MKRKYILIGFFVLVALFQIGIPANQIYKREQVLKHGQVYLFRTAPIDPTDPFRGKYVVLHFSDNDFIMNRIESWDVGETVFVELKTDSTGFAIINGLSKTEPIRGVDYIKAKIAYTRFNGEYGRKKVTVDFPFDRFYMEESKAYNAERAYWSSRGDNTGTYAMVSVKDGIAVLSDVIIKGVLAKNLDVTN